MQNLMDFVMQNKYAVAGVLGAVTLFWDKIKAGVVKLKAFVPSKSVASTDDLEEKDQNALRHLRDRAQESGNQELIKMIRSIDMMFYDIHIGAKKNETK